MQRVPKSTATGQLNVSGSETTILTVDANTKDTVSALTFTNTHTSTTTVTVHNVPSGGSVTAANMVVPTRTLAVGEAWICTPIVGQSFGAGATLKAFADINAKVNFTISAYATTI